MKNKERRYFLGPVIYRPIKSLMFIICRISLVWASSKSWRCFRVILLLLTYKSFQQHERQDTKSCQVTQMSKQWFTFLDRYAICWTLTWSKFSKYVQRSKSKLKLLIFWIKVPAWELGVNLNDESSCHVFNSPFLELLIFLRTNSWSM